jgi:hypothetical protein
MFAKDNTLAYYENPSITDKFFNNIGPRSYRLPRLLEIVVSVATAKCIALQAVLDTHSFHYHCYILNLSIDSHGYGLNFLSGS